MTQLVLKVDGMTCGHCVETVTGSIQELPGIQNVLINLESKEVTVDFDEARTKESDISAKIVGVGFKVLPS